MGDAEGAVVLAEGSEPRRLGVALFSADSLILLCRRPDQLLLTKVKAHGLPLDAKVVDAEFDRSREVFICCIESSAFEEVLDTHPIPILPPTVLQEHR